MCRSINKVSSMLAGLALMALAPSVSVAYAGNVGVDLNIHLGNKPQQVVVPAPVVPLPVQEVFFEEDINFVYPPRLGFYVAVGVPYDLFCLNNSYYLFREGRWFKASGSQGPWMSLRYRDLPSGLRRHKIDRIRFYRNEEHEVYRQDRDHYRGRHFMTKKEEWKAQRKNEKDYRKEIKREEKEDRKEMKREDKADRKAEKEERKQHKGKKDKD